MYISVTLLRCFTHPLESWASFKEGCHHFWETLKHYWRATKLLGTDIKTASSILKRWASGNRPTWREQRQLRRTVMDMFRFIPMAFLSLYQLWKFFCRWHCIYFLICFHQRFVP
eukprot:UN12862